MKNFLLIHYFLVNLVFFAWDFCVYFENIPCKAFYSGKNWVWNGSQTMWDSFQTSVIIAKNFPFLCLWNLGSVHKSVPAYACFDPRTQAAAHICGPRATFVILFPKIDFCSIKRLYFPFKHSLSQFDIWLGSKLVLGLRVWASLGNGDPSHKGYKMRCLHQGTSFCKKKASYINLVWLLLIFWSPCGRKFGAFKSQVKFI